MRNFGAKESDSCEQGMREWDLSGESPSAVSDHDTQRCKTLPENFENPELKTGILVWRAQTVAGKMNLTRALPRVDRRWHQATNTSISDTPKPNCTCNAILLRGEGGSGTSIHHRRRIPEM